MNQLIDGEWVTDAYESTNDDGEFDRQETSFRDWIAADSDAEFPAEPGRYHLYVSYACPWAHRTLVTRALRGLEDVISVDVVDPFREDDGWQFTPEREGATPDTVNGFDYLREAYVAADSDVTGRVTVPVLWDKEKETIVNNESEEVMRMLDTAFCEYANDATLYPDGYQDEIDETIDAIYEPINNGVYRAGFAGTQEAYEDAVGELFDALDHWEEVLEDQRYLCGDVLTEADVCLFTTLIRFDDVYHTHFKCNVRKISEYPNLWNYLKELYQLPGVADTVNMDHIREHYYRTHPDVNPKRIVAVGPNHDFGAEHDRDRLAGGPPEKSLVSQDEFSNDDMTRVMEESNLTGSRLEKKILPTVLAAEFDADPATLNDGMIPDRRTGIQYDAYAPDESDPWIVAWATQVKQGHFNKNFQKNLGELLFLKSKTPNAKTVMVFGIYATKQSDLGRAEDYLNAYSLFWDDVIAVTAENPLEYERVVANEEATRIGRDALETEVAKMDAREGYSGERTITLPAITGFANDYTSVANVVLQQDDWLDTFDETWFFAKLDELESEYDLRNVFKRFDCGLTPSLTRDGLREAYYSLTDLSRGSKMRKLAEEGDLDNFYYEMFEHGNPAKRWDYFNPTEGTVYAILTQRLDDGITIDWGPNGITSDGFVHQLGILNRQYEWDIRLRGETDIYIEVKSLSGGKGGSGPKQAGYEAHRVAGRSFLTRYALEADGVAEKDRHHIIVLDGYWRGPSSYETKSVDFFKHVAGFDGVYMVDDVDRMIRDIEELLSY